MSKYPAVVSSGRVTSERYVYAPQSKPGNISSKASPQPSPAVTNDPAFRAYWEEQAQKKAAERAAQEAAAGAGTEAILPPLQIQQNEDDPPPPPSTIADFRVGDIIEAVCAVADIKEADMLGPERSQRLAVPRHAAMLLAHKTGRYSYPQLGKAFGGKNHTSVMHGIKRALERLASPAVEEREETANLLAGTCERLGVPVPPLSV